MPYLRLDELPDPVKELPRRGQEIWLTAFNAAWDQYGGDEEKAFAVAWAAVRKKFEKKDGAWVPIEHAERQDDDASWFEVFRAGVHTDSAGRTREWTKADLEEIASLYNPEVHEAPIVIGHPEHDAPAYGWIEALRVAGDRLLAKPKQLAEDFRDWIRKGLYKKVSIALYPDLGLRHVGFLGAMPPAVKGLRPAQFGEAAAWQIEVDGGTKMAEKSEREKAREAQEERSRKYGISIKEGGHVTKPSEWEAVADDDFLDPVNYRYPCPDAEQTRAAAHYWARDNQAQYSQEERKIIDERLEAKKKHFKIGEFRNEGGTKMNKFKEFMELLKQLVSSAEKELSAPGQGEAEIRARMEAEFAEAKKKIEDEARAREEELRQREAVLKAQAQALAEAEAKQRRAKISAFCEGLLTEGKLTPAMMKTGMGLEAFLFCLSDMQGSFEFGEPAEDGKRKSQTALQFMEEFLSHMPKAIEYGEVGRADCSSVAGTAGERLTALTRKKIGEKKELSFGQAFIEVQKEHPELASAYAEELKSQS